MLLTDYRFGSALVIPTTPRLHPRFPDIDAYNRLPLAYADRVS
jgi:hypothetical protein